MDPAPCHEKALDGRVSLAVLYRFLTHTVTSSHHILQPDVFASLCMFKDAKFPVVSSMLHAAKKSIASLDTRDVIKLLYVCFLS